jgi:hypothetical protein
MYEMKNILSAFSDPVKFPLEAYRLIQRYILNNRGTDIMAQDWDNLVILDACRFDLFSQVSDLEGDLSKKISRGSHTSEFMNNNFTGEYPDTVYVSATPQLERQGMDDKFFSHLKLWENRWSPELETVPPGDVYDAAIEAEKLHPNKRLIIHFIQPHYPFIGEYGKEIAHETILSNSSEKDSLFIWERLESGQITIDEVWKAYRENLELTLPFVEKLVSTLTGKSVVTSDHGNEFGRFGVYGHPPKTYLSNLVSVPWLEVPFNERKDTFQGELQATESESENINEKLSALGYR